MPSKTLLIGQNNLLLAASWSGGVAPVDNDDVFILQGDTDIDTNVQDATIQLTSLTVAQHGGSIGSAGTPMIIDAVTAKFEGKGRNIFWNPPGTTTLCQWLPIGADCKLYLGSGAFTTLLGEAGTVFVGGSAVPVTQECNGGSYDIQSGAIITTINVRNGSKVWVRRDFTTLNVYAGDVYIDANGVTIGDINILGATARVFLVDAAGGGTIILHAGELHYENLRTAGTYTALTHHAGAKRYTTSGPIQPTFTTETAKGRGATLIKVS